MAVPFSSVGSRRGGYSKIPTKPTPPTIPRGPQGNSGSSDAASRVSPEIDPKAPGRQDVSPPLPGRIGNGRSALSARPRDAPSARDADDAFAGKRKFCPHCDKEIITDVELRHNVASVGSGVLLFLLFGFISICVIPFVMPLFQRIHHVCPRCQRTLESYSRFAVIHYRGGVITLKAGSCAIVLSRAYAIVAGIIALLICLMLGASFFVSNFGVLEMTKGPSTSLQWTDYFEDCGSRTLLGNPVRAEKLFEERYHDRTVNWTGARVHSVSESTLFSKHFIYLIMNPPLNPGERDLSLLFGSELRDKAANLMPGDEISFEATLADLGRRRRPILGIMWDFNITKPGSELPPIDLNGGAFAAIQNRIARPPVPLAKMAKKLTASDNGKENPLDSN